MSGVLDQSRIETVFYPAQNTSIPDTTHPSISIPPIALSPFGEASSLPSPVNRMMAAFADDFVDGRDINLGVGYVNEDTIPTELLEQALGFVRNHLDKHRQAFNYGGPAGSQNLRDSIRAFILRNALGGHTEATLRDREIWIGANGATSLLEAIGQVLEPGIVTTCDPLYYIYTDFLIRKGFEILPAPEDGEGVRVDVLEEKIAKLGARKNEIRFLYIVTVGNPTSTILSNERRRETVELATRLSKEIGREIPVVFDGAYEQLIHAPTVEAPRSGVHDDELGIVYEVGTLSKILAPALRIGYLLGPDKPLTRALAQRTSDVGFSASLMAQEMASHLLDRHIEPQIESVNRGYREKAIKVSPWIDELLGEFLMEKRGGRAGFYFYLTFKEVDTREGSPFFQFLSRATGVPDIDSPGSETGAKVVYLPGEFCVSPRGDMTDVGNRQLRLSYGFENLPSIRRGLETMREAAIYASRAMKE